MSFLFTRRLLVLGGLFCSVLVVQTALSSPLDFDLDGREDLALYDPSLGRYFVRFTSRLSDVGGDLIGGIGDVPAPGDYDDDGVSDQAIFNRSTAMWNFILSSKGPLFNVRFGQPGEIPVPGSYSGFSCTDLATFNQQTGNWTIGNCAVAGDPFSVQYGLPGDIPVPADYDGDGLDDLAVVSPSTMLWRIRVTSRNGKTTSRFFGLPGDIPIPDDYDGDGRAQVAVFRPTTNQFIVRTPSGKPLFFPAPAGMLGDRPNVIDVEEDGKADLVVYHPATGGFDISTSQFFSFDNISVPGVSLTFLNPASVPLPVGSIQFLQAVPGDFDRDLRSELTFVRRVNGLNKWFVHNLSGGLYSFDFGLPNDKILHGDTDGDLRSEPIVIRQAADGLLDWFIRTPVGDAWLRRFGLHGDQPVLGDFDCDGRDDVAVARKFAGGLDWYFWLSSSRLAETGVVPTLRFGLESDSVAAADMDGDGCDEVLVARPHLGEHFWYTHSLVTGGQNIIRWGLAETDLPLNPMDFDGDGADDPVIARTEGTFQTVYVGMANGTARIIPIGTEGTPFVGFLTGITGAEIGVYHSATNAQPARVRVHRFDGFQGDVILSTLAPRDTLVLPAGKAETVGLGTQQGVQCDLTGDFVDGPGGRLWKPVSENTHRPVFLLPRSYWSKVGSVEVFGFDGTKLVDGQRRVCCPNGNRAHYDVPQYASVLDEDSPLTVRLNFNDGGNECLTVPVASDRWD